MVVEGKACDLITEGRRKGVANRGSGTHGMGSADTSNCACIQDKKNKMVTYTEREFMCAMRRFIICPIFRSVPRPRDGH